GAQQGLNFRTPDRSGWTRMRVLIADDEPLIRSLLQNILTGFGHTVIVAENGREAFALLSAADAAFDAVISDIRMPELDGRGLIQKLRAAGMQIPVILVTGHMQVDPADAEKYGAWRILHKPFRAADLLSALSTLDAIAQDSARNKP
ncbi:MAG: response regulator, partial [SAR324 cluster bacterium]